MDYINDETWAAIKTGVNHLIDVCNIALDALNHVPGAPIVRKYIQNSYRHDPWRLFLEVVLVLIMLNYIFHRRFRPKENPVKLTRKLHGTSVGPVLVGPSDETGMGIVQEVDDLVKEWQPAPLAPAMTALARRDVAELPVVTKNLGIVSVIGDKPVLNVAAFNFLGFEGDQHLEKVAQTALRKYGVGSCGPPGFYGTIDVHMDLEKAFAKFVGMDEAILYSFGFATIASVIPAFAKRGDLVISDEGVSFAIQRGLIVSRAQIKYFKHNDVADLERVLKEVAEEDRKSKKPVNRRFIVVEGLYQNYGDIAPLKDIVRRVYWPNLVALKLKYKYRLIVEESMSMGVLGATGRGATEHAGVKARDVDAITACFANAFGAAGGLCAGSTPIVDHQTLEAHPEKVEKLRRNVSLFRSTFKASQVALEADPISPVIHIRLKEHKQDREEEEMLLQDVVQTVRVYMRSLRLIEALERRRRSAIWSSR